MSSRTLPRKVIIGIALCAVALLAVGVIALRGSGNGSSPGKSAADSEAVLQTAPLPPGHEIFELYKKGKLDEARKKVRELAKAALKEVKANRSSKAWDIECKLGAQITVEIVAACFELERQHGKKGIVPQELIDAARMARMALDLALADARTAGEAVIAQVHRGEQLVRRAEQQKAALLSREIVAFRDSGQLDRAKRLIKDNAGFIKKAGIPVDDLLVKKPPASAPPRAGAAEEISGRQAAILKLVLDFYRALSQEDAGALSALLCKGKDMRTGEDIVKQLDRERKTRKSFEKCGDVRFDSRSKVQISPKGKGEFEVKCSGIIKSFTAGKRNVTQRESDLFAVKFVDGEYKLVFAKRRK